MHASVQSPDRAAATLDTINRFNAAFNRHEVDAIMALMTDDLDFGQLQGDRIRWRPLGSAQEREVVPCPSCLRRS